MRGQELRIEQLESAQFQSGDEMGEGHFAGVGLMREHAFAEERAAQPHAIKPADQPAVAAAFERMGVAAGMQRGIEAQNLVVDPAFFAARRGRSASAHHVDERGVGRDLEPIASDRTRQPFRNMERLEWKDSALLWRNPIQFRIVAPLRHREQARGISAKQNIRRETRRMHRKRLAQSISSWPPLRWQFSWRASVRRGNLLHPDPGGSFGPSSEDQRN